MWHVFHPEEPLVWSWHLGLVCNTLQDLAQGRFAPENKVLLNIPPGTGKSLALSVAWPAWIWLRRPSAKFLAASADGGVVLRDALRHRALCQSEWYQDTFAPNWEFDKSQDSKGFFLTTAQGARVSRTVGQSVTGHRFDFGIVDDPLDARDAVSGNSRLKAHTRWFDTVYTTRRNGRAPIGIAMQRLHANDLSGHLLRREAGAWHHVILPMEYESPGYPLDPRRAEGEILSPRYSAEDLAIAKRTLGASYWGQYQQRPGSPEGVLFRLDWLRSYSLRDLPRFDYHLISVDTALRTGTSNDYTVAQVWGIKGADRYLLAQERGRWTYPEILAAIQRLLDLYPGPRVILVERANNGAAVIGALSRTYSGVLGIDQFTERNSKLSRAQVVLPLFEAGQVYIPSVLDVHPITRQTNAWVGDYATELCSFPLGAHDDQVDATTQALGWILEQDALAPWAVGLQ